MNKEENMEHPNRKRVRLPGFDYDTPGYYFITLCTTQKQKLLCDIVGTGLPDGPQVRFTQYGQIALAQLEQMCDFYDDLKVEKYVIMPNHIHMLIHLTDSGLYREKNANPTNNRISQFIGTFKRFCNRAYGRNIWQARSYDHVIRGEQDYREIWAYIDENPIRWTADRFFIADGSSNAPPETM